MEPENLAETLKVWYEEALKGNREIQDAWDASHPNSPQFSTMRKILDKIKADREKEDEPVTEVKQNVFDVYSHSEVDSILLMKAFAATTFAELYLPKQYEDNIVLAGGCFASYYHGEPVKDYDFFIIGDNTIQAEIMYQLDKRGTIEDATADYHREAKNVTAVFNERVRKRQYIYTNCKSRRELIDSFDLAHTQVSYHKGNLYLNRRTFDAIKDKVLIVNEGRNVPQWRMDKFQKRGFKFPVQPQAAAPAAPWGPYITNLADPRSGARVNPMRGNIQQLAEEMFDEVRKAI